MEFEHSFYIMSDGDCVEVFFQAFLKPVKESFDTGLGYNQSYTGFVLDDYAVHADKKLTDKDIAAAIKKYESLYMQRDIDSID